MCDPQFCGSALEMLMAVVWSRWWWAGIYLRASWKRRTLRNCLNLQAWPPRHWISPDILALPWDTRTCTPIYQALRCILAKSFWWWTDQETGTRSSGLLPTMMQVVSSRVGCGSRSAISCGHSEGVFKASRSSACLWTVSATHTTAPGWEGRSPPPIAMDLAGATAP